MYRRGHCRHLSSSFLPSSAASTDHACFPGNGRRRTFRRFHPRIRTYHCRGEIRCEARRNRHWNLLDLACALLRCKANLEVAAQPKVDCQRGRTLFPIYIRRSALHRLLAQWTRVSAVYLWDHHLPYVHDAQPRLQIRWLLDHYGHYEFGESTQAHPEHILGTASGPEIGRVAAIGVAARCFTRCWFLDLRCRLFTLCIRNIAACPR